MTPNPSPDQDDALGRQLDQYLDALASGAPLPTMAPDAELERLQPVVERLHGLAQYLAALEPDLPDDRTTDLPATESAGPPPAPPLSDIARQYGNGPAPRSAEAPERVGKYEVLRALGDGGQATAYLAFDPDLRRRVVLKCYHAARTPQEQEAVLKEGRALARVRSPYVAQCYSAERHDGVPYLVMEYVPGKNLAEVQRGKPVTIDRALELTGQLAEGLAAVHACGLLHRDIKPSNILVGDDGVPRLVDFGLAEALAAEGLGRVSGTLPYMAPEQARGESDRIDPRSDLFGLGAVLYELLTGVPPHQGATRQELLQAACDGDVMPPRQRNPKVPANVNDLCMRCLAKSPDRRFATATDLAQAIRQCRPRPGGLDLSFGLGRFRVRLVIGTAVALLLLAAVILIPPRFASHPADEVAVNYHPGPEPRQRVQQIEAPLPPAPAPAQQIEAPLPPAPAPAPPNPLPVPAPANPGTEERSLKFPAARPLVMTPRRDLNRHPLDNHDLRRDFPVKVVPLAGKVEPDGKLLLAPGEKLGLKVEVAREAYVSVWSVRENGTVVQVFPGPQGESGLMQAGEVRALPASKKEAATLTYYLTPAEEQPGSQFLYVLASSEPLAAAPPGPKVTQQPAPRPGADQKKRLEQILLRARQHSEPVKPGKKPPQLSEAVLPVQVR